MSEQPMTPEPCEHHWISYGQPSHSPLRWILKCSQCNQFNIEQLQEEIDDIVAAAEQRGAVKALRDAADYLAENKQVVIDGDEYTACNSCTVIQYEHLTYRADQIEQEGDDV